MGYNTTIMICNDAWDYFKDHQAEFFEALDPYMGHGTDIEERIDIPVGSHSNHLQIICKHHSSDSAIIIVGGNYGEEIHASGYPDHEACLEEFVTNNFW